MLGGEVFESVDSDVPSGFQVDAKGIPSADSQEMALRTAEKLLKELKPKQGQQMLSYQLLQGMLALATKKKPDIEKVSFLYNSGKRYIFPIPLIRNLEYS